MTEYAQRDLRLMCLDCNFLTYSASAATAHEDRRKHVVVHEESW